MSLVEKLRQVDWGAVGARLVILHGSALWKASPRDIDLVIYTDRDVEEVMLNAMEAVENVAGLPADVYAFGDVNEINCVLFLQAVANGVLIYNDLKGREVLIRAINVCNDYIIMREKVEFTKKFVNGVLRRVTQ
ncbi:MULTISPECIES: hypothetical protein [Pyrobaculum]|uniref:Conserved within P. aerophilum n=2 Tax=Pyrobaculum aerophilum TaxID=13773 RepID=Q8ZWB7_PYRAE|nr:MULTISPECIES: hypothetical protein [Pyrobaculum]AAL63785.1 conserved within P. aerophilum [Pyrobaculum aerophilum str. IM2]MCX8136772.1 hypothetical protein [Pyrobaculum aerophilum]HII45899.1 hypothetical protein [Pyrobaculum aerophilum]